MVKENSSKGKSTIILATLAALGLGVLIGTSLIDTGAIHEPETTMSPVSPPTAAPTGGAPVYRFLGAGDIIVTLDDAGRALPVANGENFIGRKEAFKTETITVVIDGNGRVEYKALMQQGDSIVFRWSTDGGQVYYDFHGHDEAFGPKFFTRYNEGEGAQDAGSFVAAYSGQHGWYWKNLEAEKMEITLAVAGFYDEIVEFKLKGN
jgi:hypothetical protein